MNKGLAVALALVGLTLFSIVNATFVSAEGDVGVSEKARVERIGAYCVASERSSPNSWMHGAVPLTIWVPMKVAMAHEKSPMMNFPMEI